MLNIIFGRAGSGKTEYIRSKIKKAARAGNERILLIVPEQFSFETERAVYRMLGTAGSMKIEVLSFSRLAENIFRAYGGLSGNYIDDCGKALVMSTALSELKDSLKVYRKSNADTAFVEKMLSAVTEFKYGGITPEALIKAAGDISSEALKEKTCELAGIYSVYSALLNRGYNDTLDDISRAGKMLESNNYLNDCLVFIDEFKGFTAVELEMLGHIIRQSRETFISLCGEGLSPDEDDIFSSCTTLAQRLVRAAKQQGIEVAAPVKLTKGMRFNSPAVMWAEKNLFSYTPKPYGKPQADVSAFLASDKQNEIEYIASCIKKDVLDEKIRLREIAVIARDAESYKNIISSTFKRYDIPYFYDSRKAINGFPLVVYIINAIRAAAYGMDTEAIMAVYKAGLTAHTDEDIMLLENYVFTWDIKGAMWKNEFTLNPAGFKKGFSQEETQKLNRLNRIRVDIIPYIAALADTIKSCDGETFGKSVYEFIEKTGAKNSIEQYIKQDCESYGGTAADDAAMVWDKVMEILNTFAEVTVGQEISAKRLCELFVLAVNNCYISSIPRTLDTVLMGSADRIRTEGVKKVYIIGAAEGVFPMIPKENGIFSESEKQQLKNAGLELSQTAAESIADERLIAYKAVSCASEGITVCCPGINEKGEAVYQSALIRRIADVFGGSAVKTSDTVAGDYFVWNRQSALSQFAAELGKKTELEATLHQYLEKTEPQSLLRLKNASKPLDGTIEPQTARELFGSSMTFSPTGIEAYHRCRFSYFMSRGLKIEKLRRAKLSPSESGTLIHYALEAVLTRFTPEQLSAADEKLLKNEVNIIIDEYIETTMGGKEDKPPRFKYLLTRVSTTVAKLAARLAAELTQSEFKPDAFELEIDANGDVAPVDIVTPSGETARVRGVIDRVDIMTKNGKKYLRVVDYKTGVKKFDLNDIYRGLNLQMLIYLFTACQSKRYSGYLPAGVLYMPARMPSFSIGRGNEAEEAKSGEVKELCMDGLIVEDKDVLIGMEHKGEGLFIPVAFSLADGENGEELKIKAASAKKLAAIEQLGKLEGYINNLLVKMTDELCGGNVKINPAEIDNNVTACTYCDYASVCGHEEADGFISCEKLTKEEFFSRIDGDER